MVVFITVFVSKSIHRNFFYLCLHVYFHILHLNTGVCYFFRYFFFFFFFFFAFFFSAKKKKASTFFFLFGFYGPFKNISLISSLSFIKGGQKLENPGKNHLTLPICDPSEAQTTAVRNLMD